MILRRLFPGLLGFILVCYGSLPTLANQGKPTEILWDRWGVPHIYGKNDVELMTAFGWAQAHSHGNLLLRLYGQARGQAAEYWGQPYLLSDQYVRIMGIPKRSQTWYREQSPAMQHNLDAFAAGINAYANAYPERIDDAVEGVLPIRGQDVLAHVQRVIHFHFVTSPQQLAALNQRQSPGASNAWAIAPPKSTSGHALLLANPHLPWSDLFLFYEAQLTGPGIDAYGATLVGMPMLAIAFNDHLGWTLTVNPADGVDIYELTLTDQGYQWDGQHRLFEQVTETLKIRQADGDLITTALVINHSVHGPIIAKTADQALALRVVGLDQPGVVEQFWHMARATHRQEFEQALSMLQLPLFNLLYADRQGDIGYIFNAQIPVRSQGDWRQWQIMVPGDTSQTLWHEYHPYQDLPRLFNPETGWLQNTNDPPWSSTFPFILNPDDYPPYFAPTSFGQANSLLRSQRSLQVRQNSGAISLEEMITQKFSTHLELADRVLDDLIAAARLLANPIGLDAAEVLAQWDRQTNADSQGAVLFTLWAQAFDVANVFGQPWDPEQPLSTPHRLKDINLALAVLEGVAAQVELLYGSLEVPWGEVVRMGVGDRNLPARGGFSSMGSFNVLNAQIGADERFQVIAGDSFIAAVEFADPVRAKALTVYGNASQPGSPHIGDQLALYARGELRPVWRTRSEIEANLRSRDIFEDETVRSELIKSQDR